MLNLKIDLTVKLYLSLSWT